MATFYRMLADLVVVAHASYVSFVVAGQLAILIGWLRRWAWIRNVPFRFAHLTAIAVVVLEAWCGFTCPLTTWENWLREQAGDATYQGDFIANWVHAAIFYRASPWVFTLCYSLFCGLVLLTFIVVPPKRNAARNAEKRHQES